MRARRAESLPPERASPTKTLFRSDGDGGFAPGVRGRGPGGRGANHDGRVMCGKESEGHGGPSDYEEKAGGGGVSLSLISAADEVDFREISVNACMTEQIQTHRLNEASDKSIVFGS